MSLVWTLIASFLYIEIFVTLLLVLPIASPTRWQRFFKSRFLATIRSQSQVYFYLLLGLLVLFLLEAIREMKKYSSEDPSPEAQIQVGLQHNMRLFRAQRNFYISGFSIFLTLVIRRLVTLLSAQATLTAQTEASLRQAQSATTAARSLLTQQKQQTEEGESNASRASDDSKLLKEKVKELEEKLKREIKDKEALKSQAESLNREYDRLTDEYSKLQNKAVRTTSGGKDD